MTNPSLHTARRHARDAGLKLIALLTEQPGDHSVIDRRTLVRRLQSVNLEVRRLMKLQESEFGGLRRPRRERSHL